MEKLTGDDLLWNWARWCWSGATVGNMEAYVSREDDRRPINADHARAVEAMHASLPRHERMVIIAEYPQKNAKFGNLTAAQRRTAARRWIRSTTGVSLGETEYKLYLGLFRDQVERRLA
ncbi:hypothetical protein [Bordetella pseudohinzii]|uniref:Phage protein n=1 Tax=Bordetella pseudohinzii TaxID=1331258 RepID=A0A0J6C6D4_9BORD|nr:hypothetical protein [Bordetella pseudohinzii]ANY17238.1 hypothetical protein BBN53_15955 [Bordetella pseudohinzii]KMM24867.1 hypothetical protein L540_03300 [Bordetella pseudohinzii]KXA75358.1 hypothetical protein AW877_20175 [Bordetella pseudohinzii]KXA75572.1 hypothetical protein AW878_19890 [Bordetella pseudohinzii]CUI96853.1 Uncharacterised protein [Bordetella pseudohinzii]